MCVCVQLAEEEEWNLLPNGEYTTAEPRPTAYIPQTNLLPLPKPYGAHAPFKPSHPSSNMRHIRKPTPLWDIEHLVCVGLVRQTFDLRSGKQMKFQKQMSF